jgi:hypothetical protein
VQQAGGSFQMADVQGCNWPLPTPRQCGRTSLAEATRDPGAYVGDLPVAPASLADSLAGRMENLPVRSPGQKRYPIPPCASTRSVLSKRSCPGT